MILILLKNLVSIIASPSRMAGRSWLTELCMRAAQDVFLKGQKQSILEFRSSLDKSAGYHPALAKTARQQQSLGGIPCTMVIPNSGVSSDTVVVYFHGGGYVVGSAKSHKTLLAQLALDTHSLVICPDYRLAPEHRFPAPQEDCLAIASLVLKTYSDKKIVLAGDSAGGALAIFTALELAKTKAKQLDKLVLLSPWVDPLADSSSMITNDKNDFLSHEFLESSFKVLMQGQSPHNAQVNFSNVELNALPKTLVQCGKGEVFYDQIKEFCERAEQQDVELEFDAYRAQFHVFQLFSAIIKDAEDALVKVAEFINRA